jgi:hypothetical protein
MDRWEWRTDEGSVIFPALVLVSSLFYLLFFFISAKGIYYTLRISLDGMCVVYCTS